MRLRTTAWVVALVCCLLAGFGSPALAQQYTGRIDIVVEDSTGARLPGVTVEVTGVQNAAATTDARGEARFINLAVGNYRVKATLGGFNEWLSPQLTVGAGVSIPLNIKMGVAGAKEEILVTAEAPVLDNKKQTTAVNIGLDELQNVPTARDPWVVMQSVPGIVMDRVNVGGSESGQQAGFMGKGADDTDTTWNVDGMPITDMSSLSSPFYYDFDMFQEMNIVTGGADPKSATGGIQMNFMLKSGTNQFHGNTRGYLETEGMQTTNIPDNLKYLAGKTGKGDRTEQYTDWGGDLGGPILKDRWWFWGAYGKQDIRILKLSDVRDRTLLKNASVKTQAQILGNLRGSFTFFDARKEKYGRNASPTRPQETTWNQGGPNKMYKGELNYVVGNNLFLVGRYAYVEGGFFFDPQGGMDTPTYRDDSYVFHQSYSNYVTDRPQKAFVADANYFRGNHELKLGFTWRKTQVHSTSEWPGNNILTMHDGYPNMVAQVTAPYSSDGETKYISFYAGDTITLNRMTINAGVRYDYQSASLLESVSNQVAGFEGLMPTVTAPAATNLLTYKGLQPRLGLTYSLDESRKTQLRATYAMFTSQIGTGAASFMSVVQYRWAYFTAVDTNGNKLADLNEIDRDSLFDYSGFDPDNPAASGKPIHRVGDYGMPKTHEAIVGLDRELFRNFGVSASFTWRKIVDFNWRPMINGLNPSTVINRDDYVQVDTATGSLPDVGKGGTYNTPIYGLKDAALIPPAKATEYRSRDGYSQRYWGFEVSATKRMSNRWMGRIGFSTNDWREYFDGANSLTDPTHTLASPNIDGGHVVNASGGSGKSGIYQVMPKYQFSANAAYQAPYGVDIGMSYLIRQGYPMPWYRQTRGIADPNSSTKNVLLVPDFGQDRLPATSTLDMRIGKTFNFKTVRANLDFDVFNILNSATVLGRQYNAAAAAGNTGYTQVLEIMQPRIARVGLRISF